jgi:subtilisin family serine protease
MYRFLLHIAVLLFFFGFFRFSAIKPQSTAQAMESDRYLPAEVVVKLVSADNLLAVAADYGLDPTPIDQFLAHPIFRLRILDASSPKDKADSLLADPQARIVYAEPNLIGQAPEGTARVTWSAGIGADEYRTQWAPDVIRLAEAHQVSRGAGVTVAVLDTGVDATHPALAGKLLPGYDFVDNDANPDEIGTHEQNPTYGHGTHVAGLVALAAPEAKIMPLRALDRDGVGNAWILAKALAYAIDPDGNPATSDGADVINLSLSTVERSRLIRDVLKAVICNDQVQSPNDLPCLTLFGRGAVVVAAAGNQASSIPEYPAGDGLSGAIAVGASTQSDTISVFSNFGSWVDIAAPGQAIYSTVPGGGYGTWSGTSMAAPLAAGEAALIRAVYPLLKPVKVTQRMLNKAEEIGGPVRYRIDAAAALGLGRAH